MPSAVNIANLALTFCGAESILTNLDDPIKEGRLCSQNYAFARRAVYAKAKWKFALKRLVVDRDDTSPPPFEWSSAFPVPEDYIRAVCINDRYNEWIREGRFILSNDTGPINLRYISDEQNVEVFDPLFIDCVAWDLAERIVYPLSQSNERLEAVQKQYALALRKAKFSDSIEQSQTFVTSDDFVDARLSIASSRRRTPPGQ